MEQEVYLGDDVPVEAGVELGEDESYVETVKSI